jgi:hypothetical protein
MKEPRVEQRPMARVKSPLPSAIMVICERALLTAAAITHASFTDTHATCPRPLP